MKWGRLLARRFVILSNSIIMLMSAMGVRRFIACASFHDVHRVRTVS